MEKPLRSQQPAVSWQRGELLRLGVSPWSKFTNEWQASERRYVSEASMAKLAATDNHGTDDKELGTKAKELLVS